ncbi:hypothetical protein [Prauserella halophila]|uniref:hypothetical protein n=1 Tax=Prauserella halophila TaxID=185641 RepID=UPI0020A40A8B|nr:hypothetical protein [Prauserella halophila]
MNDDQRDISDQLHELATAIDRRDSGRGARDLPPERNRIGEHGAERDAVKGPSLTLCPGQRSCAWSSLRMTRRRGAAVFSVTMSSLAAPRSPTTSQYILDRVFRPRPKHRQEVDRVTGLADQDRTEQRP